MHPDPQQHVIVGQMLYFEGTDGVSESERHFGDLHGMLLVPDGQAGHRHVRVADCLNLKQIQTLLTVETVLVFI